MPAQRLPITTLAIGLLAPLPAVAQAIDQTGKGSGPRSTVTAPYTAPTGRVVPRPKLVSPEETGSIQRRSEREQRDDTITQGICIGCAR